MIEINLNNIGKRYNYEWIFRKVNYDFIFENNYVILGSNGSGKSTLLQVIAGNLMNSEGKIKYIDSSINVTLSETKGRLSRAESRDEGAQSIIEEDNVYKQLSYCAPYLDLFEELTLTESIAFQEKFKPFQDGLDVKQIIALTELEKSKDKQLKYYSSGMKQRVRLAFAVLADTPLLLLDEPTSNLDKKAIDWYQKLTTAYSKNRLIIVASNQQEYEYPFCNKQLNIEEYKEVQK